MDENKDLILLVGKLDGKLDMVASSMANLARSFDNLEKGRLSRLEIAFAELKTSTTDSARNGAFWIAIWTSGIVGVLISVIAAVIIKYIPK